MSRGRKKSRKVINPMVEHIADYSDMEFVDNESGEALIASHAQAKIDKKCEDETDRMWMYKDNRDDEVVDEIYEYFKSEATSDSVEEAIKVLGADYEEMEIRLVRIKFLCEIAS